MTVSELIEVLNEFDGDFEVRLGIQPNYPLSSTIEGVWFDEDEKSEYNGIVYITEGNHAGYFTQRAWND